jgi:hypothetical protein
MRVPRVRFTVRRMMVLVAIVALSIGSGTEGYRLWRQRKFCLEQAAMSAPMEVHYARLVMMLSDDPSEAKSPLVNAVIPRGAVPFKWSGGIRRVHFPWDNPEPADSRTVQVLIAKCSRAAIYYGD